MGKIVITQKRSQIGSTQRVKNTLVALGLGRIGKTVEVEGTPQILGMVRKVNNLVEVQEK